jgi:Chitin synthase export chaperone
MESTDHSAAGYLTSAFIVMAGSQVVYLLANDPLCKAAQQKVDGSFIATILETVSVVLLIVTWSSVTEGSSGSSFLFKCAPNRLEPCTESWGEEGYY